MNSSIRNCTTDFGQVYIPRKALLIYEHLFEEQDIYLESYDCDETGRLINAHPLSLSELKRLSECLQQTKNVRETCFHSDAFIPENLLYLNAQKKTAIWHTKATREKLYYSQTLDLKSGTRSIPPLVWKATESTLCVYAIKTIERPATDTKLYHAPFFNIYDDGRVCMGTVNVETSHWQNIEVFMKGWQQYFFNSDFSHTIGNVDPCRTSLEILYKNLTENSQPFPENELKHNNFTLQDILP